MVIHTVCSSYDVASTDSLSHNIEYLEETYYKGMSCMSILGKLKDVSVNASKAVANEYSKQKQKADERKEQAAIQLAAKQEAEKRATEAEQIRKQKILSGDIEPISVAINLQKEEVAYLELNASRTASVDNIIEETMGKSKKKHVVGRAIVGGVLLGPLGAVGGAATAGSKNNSVTTQRTVSSSHQIDSGKVLLTSKRFMFVGNKNVVSVTYPEIVGLEFSGNQVIVKYAGMLDGERYTVNGQGEMETQLYFTGITQNLISQ